MAQYIAWELLDRSRRHSIVDTMVLVDLHRKALDSIDGLRGALTGSQMVILPETMAETAHKCRDLGGWDDVGTFADSMVSRLDESGIEYLLAEIPESTRAAASEQHSKKEYPNENGKPLSFVDCLLLCSAMLHDDVDVITADGALAGAIVERCGPNRTKTSRTDYYKRRDDTKWFVGVMFGHEVEWVEEGTELRYEAGGNAVVVLDTSSYHARLVSCSIDGKPSAGEAIRTYFMGVIDAWQCQCRADTSEPFRCSCPDFPYYPDGSMDYESSEKFLDSMPPRERDGLLSLVLEFQPWGNYSWTPKKANS